MSDDAGLGPLFFEVHRDLPREGPGSDASTRRALDLARPHVPNAPHVIDAGCGPGAQTRVLAAELEGASITALDLHAPFLEQLRAALPASHAERVDTLVDDMAVWTPPRPVDLIWCEGAAYAIGVPRALAHWRTCLRPGGVIAFSEAVWLTDERSAPTAAFWEEYPAMTDVDGCRRLVDEAGYERLGDFVLPRGDWSAYYAPIEERLDALAERHANDARALEELAAHRREIDVFRASRDEYSYLFVVARWPGPGSSSG